jgi:hypothetical protein
MKSGQIEYPHAIPCGFFPKFRAEGPPFCAPLRKAAANFPSIIKGLWSLDIFSGLALEMPNKEILRNFKAVRHWGALRQGAVND